MSRKAQVFAIEYVDGEVVYCRGRAMTNRTVAACLRVHPDEPITVRLLEMSKEEYESLPEYTGDC